MRHEARRDSNRDRNEPEIVAAFEVCGARVWKTLEPVDLLVAVPTFAASYPWRLLAVEIKPPLGPRGGGAGLRPAQRRFFDGMPPEVRYLVRTAAEAFALVPASRGFPSSASARARALASRGFPSA